MLFQNSELLVVDKPVGMSVHNIQEGDNLLEWAQRYFQSKEVHPVHRLDKETSGVQLLALTPAAAQKYQKLMGQKQSEKVYRGIVRGKISEGEGTWSHPLSDKAEGRDNPAGKSADRMMAVTHFQVLQSSPYLTEMQFKIETGRQHQIRKHCAISKHAIVGDARYGDKKFNSKMVEIYKTQRMMLHCQKMQIAEWTFEAAVPEEFLTFFS